MQLAEELSVPQVATYLKVNEETVRRNIRSKRLSRDSPRYPMVR